MKKITGSYYIIFCFLIFHAAFTSAQSVDEMVKRAAFIFEGTVIAVQFRLSEQSNGEPSRNPYTFVTYQVHRILKGNYNSGQLTLRFVGGIDEQGIMFSMDGTPRFDVGDHDLLLVGNNGYSLCPLINCSQGRFRFIQGLVVNEYGQLIELNGASLRLGQAVDLNEVATNKMGPNTLTRHEVKNVDGEEVPIAIPRAQANTGSMPDAAGFTSYMEQKVLDNHDSAELGNMQEFNSANPDVPFRDELLERIYTQAEDPGAKDEQEDAATEESTEDEAEPLTAKTPSLLSNATTHKKTKTEDVEENTSHLVTAPVQIETSAYTYALIFIVALLAAIFALRSRAKRIHVPKQG